MLNSSQEYALRIMAVVARLGGMVTVKGVVSDREVKGTIPPAYAAKIVGLLTKAGLVVSRRGKSGGLALAKPPQKISALEIVESVETLERQSKGTTALDKTLDGVVTGLRKGLGTLTLANVAGNVAKFGEAPQASKPAKKPKKTAARRRAQSKPKAGAGRKKGVKKTAA